MVLTHIPRAIGKLRLPLPPIISLESETAYTHRDRRASYLRIFLPCVAVIAPGRVFWAVRVVAGGVVMATRMPG